MEITGKCQLECGSCYALSGPQGDHGSMTAADWRAVIDAAAKLGVPRVQFIGGEPTMHPDLASLVSYALRAGVEVEVFTNLVHVSERLWEVFGRPGVRLATSYYSPDPRWHDQVTGRRGSHARTRANIIEAVRRGILLRVGLINTGHQADVDAAEAELLELGVTRIGRDGVRPLGRAAVTAEPDPAALCGGCGTSQATILPSGELVACGMGRWLVGGNVHESSLAELFASERWRAALAAVPRRGVDGCNPDADGEDCSPAERPPCQPEWDS